MARGQTSASSAAAGGMRMVVAVDFGTTYTTVAYANSLYLLKNWGSGGDISQDKVPTVLRYDNGGTTGAYCWGYRAQQSAKDKRIHEWFKLGLCSDFEERRARESELIKKYKSKTALPPVEGEVCMNLVVNFLSGVKDAVDKCFNSIDEDVARCPRDYIVTVPALWDHAEQEKTRQCAERAGMGSGAQLQIISEPEAACIFAIQNKISMKVNETFVICDAGGGTVDLASYTIESLIKAPFHCKLSGAATGSGGLCGTQGLSYWEASFMIDALKDFEERIKPNFNGENKEGYNIRIGGLIKSERHGIDKNFLSLTTKELRQNVFEEVISKIQGLVRDQIAQTRGSVKEVILAGGFGNNPYLKKRLEKIDLVVNQGIKVQHFEDRLMRPDGDKIEKISWFALRGESIPNGQPMSFRFVKVERVVIRDPHFQTQALFAEVHIYTCERETPAEFANDSSVWEMAQFTLDLTGLTLPIIQRGGQQLYEAEFFIEMTLRGTNLSFCGVYGIGTSYEKRFPGRDIKFL
ncbi:uncharacterized protein RAG0_03781 [Rhynchosporium agropyri]|uniref:Hsp70 protein n=1 Tax=Rhynchosporium agropyri TaxID=914238 RepID=A0A1E1K5Z4_9HELO|nr:uncharacterized protein RAG0_03781 [Rhynchosporium agropyri]